MDDILTVTLNPALDRTTSVEVVRPGPKLRCASPMIDPGGGGINASRAIGYLGGVSRALVAVGGATGDGLLRLMAVEGIETLRFDAPGETRQSLAVTDRKSGAQYRFVLPGPDWSLAEAERAMAAIVAAVRPKGLVVLSGSQPPGVAIDFPRRLARLLAGRARLIVDVSGAPLIDLARGGDAEHAPWLLRMDDGEAEDLAGRPLAQVADSVAFAEHLHAAGAAQVVIIARGADGAVLVGEGKRIWAPSAKVTVVSKVGAGDSFVGAFTLSVARGESLEVALQWGNAAASAAVTTDATRLCARADVERLFPQCRAMPV